MAHSDSSDRSGTRLPGALLLVAGMAFFGSATPVSKLVGNELPLAFAAALRLLLAGLVLLPFAWWRGGNPFALRRRDWLVIAAIAVFGNVGFTLSLLYGLQLLSGVASSVIMSVTPALTAVAAVVFLHERMRPAKIGALALGVAGVLVTNVFSAHGDASTNVWLGSLLVFAAVCCEVCYTTFGKVATGDVAPLQVAAVSALLAGVLLLPAMFWQAPDVDLAAISFGGWAAVLWWGLGTMALGSVAWYSGVERVPGHVAAGFMAVMPVSALLLSYVLLGEPFQWVHVLGFGLALGGVVLMSRVHAREAAR